MTFELYVDCDGLQKGLIFMFLKNNRKEKIFPKKNL